MFRQLLCKSAALRSHRCGTTKGLRLHPPIHRQLHSLPAVAVALVPSIAGRPRKDINSMRRHYVAGSNLIASSTAAAAVAARDYSMTATASSAERMEFQAETRKLLDIVTHSIYTDKEVFVRELISNASDALEKFRYKQNVGEVSAAGTSDEPLEINILTDPKAGTLSIVDNGIGMSREELIANLGTIARSGSKNFVEQMSTAAAADAVNNATATATATEGIIGQFGVGFYSAFMVSDTVTVESVSAAAATTAAAVDGAVGEQLLLQQAHKWSSDGSGVFEIDAADASALESGRGCKITMHLKKSCSEYADGEKIRSIIKRYSNFVSFPIRVDGELVNTVSAIWAQDKSSVTEEQYQEFYKFISHGFDSPKYRLHFRADAPIELKCLFYVPSLHAEKFGMGRTEPGVNLYSRKVLIESKPKDLLPEWLRFVKGAVDSEDLPLSLSREKPQDSNLLRRIRDVLTRKLLRFFSDEMKNAPQKYREFYAEYHMFLKEGVCQDYNFTEQLSKLLLFESSAQLPGEQVSLDDYISRCAPEQKQVFYLVAPNREAALKSPYFETFKKHSVEVLLLYNTIDEFAMANIKTYAGRELTSAEGSSIDLSALKSDDAVDSAADTEEKDADSSSISKKAEKQQQLSDSQARELCAWLTASLGGGRVREVRITRRLSDSPAIVTDHESGALRRMMKMVEQANAGAASAANNDLPPQVLEINPSHPLMVQLFALKDDPSSAASLVAEQLMDNCLMAAGLIEDPRFMLPRLNDILLASLRQRDSK